MTVPSPALARPAPSPTALAPVLAAVVGIALFTLMDALMKRASLAGGVWPALFARSVAGALVLAPVWRLRGGRWPAGPVLRLHVLRGLLASGMASSFFYGVVIIPLAEGIAISFIAPLIALGLAALVLGEQVRRAAVGAALIGLAGVLVIAWGRLGEPAPRPHAAWGIASILLSAVLYAWNLIIQRQQAQVASPLEVALSQNVMIALVLGLAAPLVAAGSAVLAGDPPGTVEVTLAAMLVPVAGAWPDILGAALLSSTSLMLLSWAYARAEAQRLVPVEYTAFLWSALMGWLWFAEPVTGWTLAGLALILGGVWLGTRRAAPAADRAAALPP
ncbi:DMT family transporter [Novosphingobium piscinae]|uniref:DMT family transporter n=1 Tax=Novosphingobium piscinae TaxID=1507448 RepID=A0A7X1G1C1_9SPHN|nr:DMT family transporter [Novosphingobium piscinae]MBC2670795.1 DMT family transporter [Novosphingobium piscinae]